MHSPEEDLLVPPDWEELLLAFLHDPPGKALDIAGHEDRAARLATLALAGPSIALRCMRTLGRRTSSPRAWSASCRCPLREWTTAAHVSPEKGRLRVVHPLSGAVRELDAAALARDAAAEEETLAELVRDLDPPRARFLAVWRLWGERLARGCPDRAHLPADTRLPDHTVWNHLDAAAGLRPILGQKGPALLSFSLGPVQAFIASARSLRDLWTGSYLLSWLTFAAMRPVLEACGPAAVVSPALRGNPLLDRYLRELPWE